MASLIPGYEYDIFISYRQNDNRSGWVTEFVQALKGELSATVKGDVSVYFDANPIDGLLESHDVGKSLGKKLKCIILIPIVSQTYCDTKSYAWMEEFMVFNKIAREDPIGMDINLLNGNVCSRILPVQIHELEQDDRKLLEKETNSKFRPIEFIFREPGVNRPLEPVDLKRENQNQTDYRNQLNKVANAIKEILYSVIQGIEVDEKANITFRNIPHRVPAERIQKNFFLRRRSVLFGTAALMILISLASFFIWKYLTQTYTIAIMPISYDEKNPRLDYALSLLSDGIVSNLNKVPGLYVRPTSEVLQFKSEQTDLNSIAKTLNVKSILSIRPIQHRDSVILIAELVEVGQYRVLWKKRYQNSLSYITDAKQDIASNITNRVRPNLNDTERKRLQIEWLYESGRYYWNKRTVEGFTKAIGYFNQILEMNNQYAPAYAGLADSYLLLNYYGSPTSSHENFVKSKNFAIRALNIDNNLAEAHTSLAMCMFQFDFNLEGAEKEFRTAIELNPRYATSFQWLGELLTVKKQFNGAIQELAQAEQVDPLSRIIKADFGLMHYHARNYEHAINKFKETLRLDPNFNVAHWWMGLTYTAMGDFDDAFVSYEAALKGTNNNPRIRASLAYTLARSGDKNSALKILNDLRRLNNNGAYVSPYEFAVMYTGLQENDRAFLELNKLFDERPYDIIFINVEPMFDSLRSDPRFDELVKRIGLQ